MGKFRGGHLIGSGINHEAFGRVLTGMLKIVIVTKDYLRMNNGRKYNNRPQCNLYSQ